MFYLVSGTVAEAALTTVNASLNTPIDENILVAILQSGELHDKKWLPHISIFFNEVPVDVLRAFIKEYGISKSNFMFLHSKLPSFFRHPSFNKLMNAVYL